METSGSQNKLDNLYLAFHVSLNNQMRMSKDDSFCDSAAPAAPATPKIGL
jgi:hypothetical protein